MSASAASAPVADKVTPKDRLVALGLASEVADSIIVLVKNAPEKALLAAGYPADKVESYLDALATHRTPGVLGLLISLIMAEQGLKTWDDARQYIADHRLYVKGSGLTVEQHIPDSALRARVLAHEPGQKKAAPSNPQCSAPTSKGPRCTIGVGPDFVALQPGVAVDKLRCHSHLKSAATKAKKAAAKAAIKA